jgi:hypothetical protein
MFRRESSKSLTKIDCIIVIKVDSKLCCPNLVKYGIFGIQMSPGDPQ